MWYRNPQLLGALALLVASTQSLAADAPWRLSNVLELPEGFSISGTHRARLETIGNNVRLGTSKNDELLTFQTFLNTRYEKNGFSAQVELIDVRQALADIDSVIDSTAINTLDIQQANVGYRFGADNNSSVRIGRFSADYGSRRFVSRHRFGNAPNSFDGIEFQQRGKSGYDLRILATQPVRRLPTARNELLDNERASDKSSSGLRFYGAYLTLPEVAEKVSLDLFGFALREKDTAKVATRNRNIDTVGFRLVRPPAVEAYNFEVESAYQNGRRHSGTSPFDVIALDHEAYYQYLMVGYSFDVPSRLRVMAEYSYASGDKTLFDRNSGSFDSLYGVTTFEFGPTGMYGMIDRHNISSPGVRAIATITPGVELMLSYQHYWLAEARDTLGRTGRRDQTGRTDSYMGRQLEARVRWDLVPGNVRIETGGAVLHTENLVDEDTLYFYSAAIFTF